MVLTPYALAHACYQWAPSAYGYPYRGCCCGPYGYGWAPLHEECCMPKHLMLVPQDEMVDGSSSPREVFVGGLRDAGLTLEYMPVSGATSASVKLTISGPGGTTTWEETSVSEGFHVKRDLSRVPPGSSITIEVTEAIARLRWCELICC